MLLSRPFCTSCRFCNVKQLLLQNVVFRFYDFEVACGYRISNQLMKNEFKLFLFISSITEPDILSNLTCALLYVKSGKEIRTLI
jgi:hypothetical protein